VKQKLLAEIDPLMARHIDNLADYSMDAADDGLVYTRMAYLESLRIEPPASITAAQTLSRDVTLSGKKVGNTQVLPKIHFRKGDGLVFALESIQRDPKQWIEPLKFIPERFDEKSEYFLRPNGEPRNPISFTPFIGGKRICLGKTFAEITTKFTVPLLYYHFDFDYVEPKHKESKPLYTLGC